MDVVAVAGAGLVGLVGIMRALDGARESAVLWMGPLVGVTGVDVGVTGVFVGVNGFMVGVTTVVVGVFEEGRVGGTTLFLWARVGLNVDTSDGF